MPAHPMRHGCVRRRRSLHLRAIAAPSYGPLNDKRPKVVIPEETMRLANHLFYALAALISVFLIAFKDPAFVLAVEDAHGSGRACRSDRLELPCDPGIQVAGMMQNGRVTAR